MFDLKFEDASSIQKWRRRRKATGHTRKERYSNVVYNILMYSTLKYLPLNSNPVFFK